MATDKNAIATEQEVFDKGYAKYSASSYGIVQNKCCTKKKAVQMGVDEKAVEKYSDNQLVKYEDCYKFKVDNPGINLRIIMKADGLSNWLNTYEDLYFVVGVKYTTQNQTTYKETKLSVRKQYIAAMGVANVNQGGGQNTCFNPYSADTSFYNPSPYVGVTNIPINSSYGGSLNGNYRTHPGSSLDLTSSIYTKDSDYNYNSTKTLYISVSLYGGPIDAKLGSGSGGGTLLKQLNSNEAVCRGGGSLIEAKNGSIIGSYGGPNNVYIPKISGYIVIYENSTVYEAMQPYNLSVVSMS